MELFDSFNYPREKRNLDVNIEEFLTTEDSSGIYLAINSGFINKRLCAVNYGTSGPNKPIRGIQDGKNAWHIDIENKKLTRKKGRNILFDADKIVRRAIFEGSMEQILQEFENRGYILEETSP